MLNQSSHRTIKISSHGCKVLLQRGSTISLSQDSYKNMVLNARIVIGHRFQLGYFIDVLRYPHTTLGVVLQQSPEFVEVLVSIEQSELASTCINQIEQLLTIRQPMSSRSLKDLPKEVIPIIPDLRESTNLPEKPLTALGLEKFFGSRAAKYLGLGFVARRQYSHDNPPNNLLSPSIGGYEEHELMSGIRTGFYYSSIGAEGNHVILEYRDYTHDPSSVLRLEESVQKLATHLNKIAPPLKRPSSLKNALQPYNSIVRCMG
ncbi:hypothetical protein GQ44DRAFT_377237 [Phaeosphaeriaceae sp. PMI808]|nr:hypothetical protein GQ44DRAFT_377237 [Phaeosphaeriaceae sp. PMI808]